MKNRIIIFLLLGAFSLYAQELRIEPETLSNSISSYKIIDVREPKAYQKAHILNSINFPADLTYENKNFDGRITNPNTIQQLLRERNLDVDDNIIVYDDGSFYDAARVFWTLEVYGFKNVKLLNAGFEEWQEKNYAISDKKNEEIKTGNYIASVNNKRLATKFTTQIATKSPEQVIIDARTYDEYIGEKSVAKRFGHIPKAIHIPAFENLNKEETNPKLKDIESLKDLYKGIDKNKKVVIYCSIGKIAATNYFALRELQYDVSNYDASWKEWGDDDSLPIVNKSAKQN